MCTLAPQHIIFHVLAHKCGQHHQSHGRSWLQKPWPCTQHESLSANLQWELQSFTQFRYLLLLLFIVRASSGCTAGRLFRLWFHRQMLSWRCAALVHMGSRRARGPCATCCLRRSSWKSCPSAGMCQQVAYVVVKPFQCATGLGHLSHILHTLNLMYNCNLSRSLYLSHVSESTYACLHIHDVQGFWAVGCLQPTLYTCLHNS